MNGRTKVKEGQKLKISMEVINEIGGTETVQDHTIRVKVTSLKDNCIITRPLDSKYVLSCKLNTEESIVSLLKVNSEDTKYVEEHDMTEIELLH